MKEEQLIFIISQPRSGSTLLQALLSNNQRVATTSESWLLLPFLSHNNKEVSGAIYNSNFAIDAINQFKERIGTDGFDLDLKRFLIKQYIKVKSNRKEKFVLDKTPRYYEILPEILNYFPKAKIIVLKRNPFAVLASIINTWKRESMDDLVPFYRDVLHAPNILQEFLTQQRENSNVREVFYEDLIEQPTAQLGDLLDWIGIKRVSVSLDLTHNNKIRGLMGDPNFDSKATISAEANTSYWRKLTKSKEWNDFFRGYANYLGDEFLKRYGEAYRFSGDRTPSFDNYIKLVDSKRTF